MTWKYHQPKFEFSKELSSSWRGHIFFAYDLIANTRPETVVELGTHYGVSFFSMCQAVKDFSLNTKLHAVDSWSGDAHAKIGYSKKDLVYDIFKENVDLYYKNLEIEEHRCLFDEARENFSNGSIDVLHIDGYHTYDAVKHDFESWLPKMKKEGMILLHDIHERKEDFGVYKLWKEIKEKYSTLEFYHWHGLGVVFLDKNLKKQIIEDEDECRGVYNNLADRIFQENIRSQKDKFVLERRKNRQLELERENKKKSQNYCGATSGKREIKRKGKPQKDHNNSRKNKIAIYTAIFGDYDELIEPKKKIKGCDFYCFTDNDKLKSDLFEIIKLKRQYSDPTRDARKIKTLAHEYLPDYEYTLWIDGNINFREHDVEKMFSDFLAEHDVAIHKHNLRNCVYDEFGACIKYDVDSAYLMTEQITGYLKDGYPVNNGLAETSVVFRRNTDLSKKINEDWWNEIKNNSKRDQLSVDYVFWKNRAEYYRINESVRDGKYFFVRKHKSSNYSKRDKSRDVNELEKIILEMENDSQGYLFEKLKKENLKKTKIINQLKTSKSFRLGDLFFRSIKNPWKLMTFPFNFFGILLESKKEKSEIGKKEDNKKTKASEKKHPHLPVFSKIKNSVSKPIYIIIPIYNAYQETVDCVESIKKNTKQGLYHLLLIDDCSPDKRVGEYLSGFSGDDDVSVMRNEKNLGFVKTANRGMKAAKGDVVLLNSDTKVTKNWLRKMIIAAYSDEKVGTVTPFSNSAGPFSIPNMKEGDELPSGIGLDEVGLLVEKSSKNIYPGVPTGHGFCMLIKRKLIEDIGFFDEERFGKGYGEENDFCMRAKKNEWKNIIDDSTFIYHKGHASFSGEKEKLIKMNRETLNELYPTYTKEIKDFINSDKINNVKKEISKALDAYLENQPKKIKKRILYVLHEGGNGGVPNTNNDLMMNVEKKGYDIFVLTSDAQCFRLYKFHNRQNQLLEEWPLETKWDVKNFSVEEYGDIYFNILLEHKIDIVHIRHLIKHSFDIIGVCNFLGIKLILSFHDFYYICPSIHLVTKKGDYCSGACLKYIKEPCNIPMKTIEFDDTVQKWTLDFWRKRMEKELAKIDAFVTTADFVKKIHEKTYPLLRNKPFEVIEHGRDFNYDNDYIGKRHGEKIRMLIPGQIGFHKGSKLISDIIDYDKSKGCRFDFHCIGDIDDHLKGKVVYYGRYQREQFYDLAKKIKPSFVGIFSIFPETYCHTLTEAWSCGLPCIVSDIGAIKERVKKNGGGIIIDRKDVVGSYQAIINAYDDSIRYQELLKEVKKIKIKSTRSMAEKYLDLYEIIYKET